jgi:DNA-binding transcriptional ArsR family regulator
MIYVTYLIMEIITAIPDEFLDRMADKFRVLAETTRLAVIRALVGGEESVAVAVEETRQTRRMSRSTSSRWRSRGSSAVARRGSRSSTSSPTR